MFDQEMEDHYKRLLDEACREIARLKIENEALKKETKRLKSEIDFYQFNKNTLRLPVGEVQR